MVVGLHLLLQPGVLAFDMIVCSRPIVVVVVPLLESELAIDPDTVKLLLLFEKYTPDKVYSYKVIDIVQLWGFLLNSLESLPHYSNKAFEDSIRPVLLLQSQSLNLLPDCLGVVV